MSFKKILSEEITSSDIAPVETKLSMSRRSSKPQKGKRCKKHKQLNCEICEEQKYK